MPASEPFRHTLTLSGVLMTFLLTGCGSAPIVVGNLPPAKYDKVGTATG